MKPKTPLSQTVPFTMVGSTQFGRYPKISIEQTFNMIMSNDFLVDFAGYKKVLPISENGEGRGLFVSTRLGKMIAVIDNGVFTINADLVANRIGSLDTFSGDVFIDENNGNQIAICDKSDIYIYNYSARTFQKITTDFIPAYVAFQDGYFIAAVTGQPKWRLSNPNDGTTWPAGASNVGEFETKANNVVAAFPVPQKGNLLFVMGDILTEAWVDTGAGLFPYQKLTQINLDYGCLNPATIAFGDDFVVWLGINQKSGPVILLSQGSTPTQLSDEGFNFRFSQLNHPEKSVGFLFKQDGHLIYQLTFYDTSDNLSLAYDFSTQRFFTLTDEYMNFHIAKRVVFFNNTYYFVSFRDGNIYEFSTQYTTLDGQEIPRVRVTNNIRLPDRFVINNLNFLLEQGDSLTEQRIDLTISKDGGESFSNGISKVLNSLGRRQNRCNFWQLGAANDVVFQFRFWGQSRYVVGNGTLSMYQ